MTNRSVTIIDYGMGNIWSVKSAFEYLKCDVTVSSEPRIINEAGILILPGVGSFSKAMNTLRKLNLDNAILESVFERKTKFLGICLGMQLLANGSTEDGETEGLKIIDADVDRFLFREVGDRKLPHVGFNQVKIASNSNLFRGISSNSDFYFVHSFRILPTILQGVSTTCDYGIEFLAAFENENIFATQFHPEKSQSNGLKLLDNFLKA